MLGLILKDKQVDKYNFFATLEDIKRMLKNQRFFHDKIDSRLAHVESHIVRESDNGDLMDPPSSSARAPMIISSLDNDQ